MKAFILISLIVNLSSCAVKTYFLSEKNAFTPTKYDISLDSFELEDFSVKEQQKWLTLAEKIINTSDTIIFEQEYFCVKRKFFDVNDSIKIEYLSYEPQDYKQTIVFFIGNQSRQTSYLTYLTGLALETNSKVITWNYRGYGNSNGRSSFKTQFQDNQHIFECLHGKEEEKPLYVIGYSLGSVFATELGVNNTADKLILLAPVSDVSDMLKHYKRRFLSGLKVVFRPFIRLEPKEEYVLNISNTGKIKTYTNDLLIVQAKDDRELPYRMGKKLFKESVSENKKFLSLKKGGHGAPLEEANWTAIINWIKGI